MPQYNLKRLDIHYVDRDMDLWISLIFLPHAVAVFHKVEGYTDTTLGYGGGESSGKFEKIAAYFKKQV